MPREPSPERKRAYEIYAQHAGNVDLKAIAASLGIPEGTVRGWKNKDSWEHQLNGTFRKHTERSKRGAPVGNRNAAGNKGGPPKGSQNNLKHGLYEKLIFETLSDDEKAFARDLDIDEATELRREIRMCEIHIGKLMLRIREAETKPGGLLIKNVSKTDTSFADGKQMRTTQTNTVSASDMILRYDHEIQKFKKIKIKCLETLARMGYDGCRLEIDMLKAEVAVQANEAEEPPNTNLMEALNAAAKEVWHPE